MDLESTILAVVRHGFDQVEILLDGEVIYPLGPLHRVDFGWLETCTGRDVLSLHTFEVFSGGKSTTVKWLRPAGKLAVVDARSHSISLSYTAVNIDALKILKKEEREIESRIEIASVGPWRSSRHSMQKVPLYNMGKFIPLPIIERDATGVTVQDLEPATWYQIRLRVKFYHSKVSTVSEPITVATRCAPPDAPVPRPRVIEILQESRQGNEIKPKLKVSWAPSNMNGYPILRYILQQRECLLEDNIFNPHNSSTTILRWTEWRQVHAQLLPEHFVRPPSHDPAALLVAKRILGQTDFLYSKQDEMHHIEQLPRFIALEFRVAAVNALGASDFSQVTRVTREDCPRILEHSCQKLASSGADKSPLRSFATEAKLQQLARALDFPVNTNLLHNALLQLHPKDEAQLSSVLMNKTLPPSKEKGTLTTRASMKQKQNNVLLPAQRNLMAAIRNKKKKCTTIKKEERGRSSSPLSTD